MTRCNWTTPARLAVPTIVITGMLASTAVHADEALMDGLDLTQPCKIGFSQSTMNHPWRVAMV